MSEQEFERWLQRRYGSPTVERFVARQQALSASRRVAGDQLAPQVSLAHEEPGGAPKDRW